MNNQCEVCIYLENYEDKEVVHYLNSIIVQGFSYEEIQKECVNKPIPNEDSFKKHQLECLENFPLKELEMKEDNDSSDYKSISNKNLFSFKDHSNESGESRIVNLKKEWLSISEKLTQIVLYNINKYNPDKITTSENIKETVANLKTMSDLARAEFTFEFLNKEEDMFCYLNNEETKTVYGIMEDVKKRQLALKNK
jgi:hypothetical protein